MRVLIFFIFLSSNSFSQGDIPNILIPPHIKTQRELLKYQALKYLKTIPRKLIDCTRFLFRGSSYHRILRREGPKGYRGIFKLNHSKRFPNTSNQFSFNYRELKDVCDIQYGTCQGYTGSMILWNRLAHFDPQNISGANFPTDVGSDEWFEYYKVLIDKIQGDRDPVIIPGYKHLRQFSSSHPRIKKYLKEHVLLEWAERNANLEGYFKIFNSVRNNYSFREAKILHTKLNKSINELGFNPAVWIAQPAKYEDKPDNVYIHVMQAFRVDDINPETGSFDVHFWDIGNAYNANRSVRVYTISTTELAPNGRVKVIEKRLKPNGDVYENGEYFDIAEMEIMPFDNTEAGRDAAKLIKFYKENPVFAEHLEKEANRWLEENSP